MSINILISIGLYASGMLIYGRMMYGEFFKLVTTELKEDFEKECLPDIFWPFVVFILAIVYMVLLLAWPYWVIRDLWKELKKSFMKS